MTYTNPNLSPAQTYRIGRALRVLFKKIGGVLNLKQSKRWNLAIWPKTGIAHIFVDGWLSAGNDSEHIAAKHKDKCGASLRNPLSKVVRSHSYGERGRTYVADDTLAPMSVHVDKLLEALLATPNPEKAVITGFSMGTVVSLVALGRYLRMPSKPLLIRKLILLEPALYGAPHLVDVLRGLRSSPFHTKFGAIELPDIVLHLTYEDSPWLEKARQAITDLLDAGVSISVIYYPEDQFVSYHPFNDARIDHHQTPETELLLDGEIDEVFAHFIAADASWNHRLIMDLAKAYLRES